MTNGPEELQCPYCLKQINSRTPQECHRCGETYTKDQIEGLNGPPRNMGCLSFPDNPDQIQEMLGRMGRGRP